MANLSPVFLPSVVLAAMLGLAVGSFITALTARLDTGMSVLRGRSRCVHCDRELRWFELLPVASFLIQGGRCRSCRGEIPRSYLVIELVTAALFAGLAWAAYAGQLPIPAFLGSVPPGTGAALRANAAMLAVSFLSYALFAAVAVAISFYDFAHRLIPGVLVWPLAAIGLLDKLIGAFLLRDVSIFAASAGVAGAAFVLFWSLWFFSNGRAMGRGDADVALAIGFYLDPALALAGFLFAFWIGAAGGILLVAAGRLGWKSQIPFSPFLFAGGLLALFLAERINEFAASFYGF